MLNKKAQGGPRKPISLALGVAFIVLGLLPLLKQAGFIGFALGPLPEMVIYVMSIIGGLILFWDAISEGQSGGMGMTGSIMMGSYIVGLVALVLGLIPLLNSLGVIGFALPTFGEIIINVLFTVTGVLLLFGGIQGF